MAKKPVAATVEKFPKVGTFTEKKALQKHYKGLTDAEVTEWVAKEGLTVKDYGSAPINRMRACMAILYLHFPADAPKPKEASKYADYTLEDLVGLAVEHSVPVEVTDNERILRMRTIMALRAHKVIV